MGSVTFNNVSTTTLGILVEVFPDYEIPERSMDIISVPGRNGDIIIDHGTYKNVNRVYRFAKPCDASYPTPAAAARVISNWLMAPHGYRRLQDSYDSHIFGVYRDAYFKGGVTVSNINNEAGRLACTFVCKPQRFIITETMKVTDKSQQVFSLSNLYPYDANPIITITANATGKYTIFTGDVPAPGSVVLQLSMNSGQTLVIDTETKNVYSGVTSWNEVVTVINPNWIKLAASTTTSFVIRAPTGGTFNAEVDPRWWTL